MTSKISFFRLLREDLKRRSWLTAMIALLFFLIGPVTLMMRIDREMNAINMDTQTLENIRSVFMNYIAPGGNYVDLIFAMITAVVCGITGYSYLHSKVKLDFYHSLAVKRGKFFFVQYLSGVIIFAAPYLLCTVINIIIGGANGFLTGAVVAAAMQAYVFRLLFFLVIYVFTILATVLTGRIIVAILGTTVLLSYPLIIYGTGLGMASMYWATYNEQGISERIFAYLSPAGLCIYLENLVGAVKYGLDYNGMYSMRLFCGLGLLIIEVLIITGIALWLSKIRSSEAAGKAMAFAKTEAVIKALLVVPGGLLVGMYFAAMKMNNSLVWFFGGIIAGVLILSAVIEFIYHTNMRELFVRKLQVVLMVAAAIFIAIIFRFDVFGYDSYLPREDAISKMAVYNPSVNGEMLYKMPKYDGGNNYNSKIALNETLTEHFGPIYELAQKGVEYATEDTALQNADWVLIEYQLNSGRKVYRQYYIEPADTKKMLQELMAEPDYREAFFPLLQREEDQIATLRLVGREEDIELNKEQRAEFIEIYKDELRNTDYEDIAKNTVDSLMFQYRYDGRYYSDYGYPITKSFVKTIAYLREVLDEPLGEPMDAAAVSYINVGYTAPSGETTISDSDSMEEYSEQTYFNPEHIEQIREILEYVNQSGTGLFARYEEQDIDQRYSVNIVTENGENMYGPYQFQKDKIPEFLKEYFEGKAAVDK